MIIEIYTHIDPIKIQFIRTKYPLDRADQLLFSTTIIWYNCEYTTSVVPYIYYCTVRFMAMSRPCQTAWSDDVPPIPKGCERYSAPLPSRLGASLRASTTSDDTQACSHLTGRREPQHNHHMLHSLAKLVWRTMAGN